MTTAPLFEATMKPKEVIEHLRHALLAVQPLTTVFPFKEGDSSSIDFPYSVASVVYAIFHRDSDPVFYNQMGTAVAGREDNNARLTFDGVSGKVFPTATKDPKDGAQDRLKKFNYYSKDPIIGQKPDFIERRDILAGYFNDNEKLKQAGAEFSEAMFNMVDFATKKSTDGTMYDDLLDKFAYAKKKYTVDYVKNLKNDKPLAATGEVPAPKDLKSVTTSAGDAEIYAYMACMMSDDFGAEALAALAGEASPKKLVDSIGHAISWLEDTQPKKQEYERLTGDQPTEYVAINIDEDEDMVGANVAPEYLIPMFAQDCEVFIDDEMKDEEISRGYRLIAQALGISMPDDAKNSEFKDTINKIIAELANDVEKAIEARRSAITVLANVLKKNPNNPILTDLISGRILRYVFQVMEGQYYTEYPTVSGSGEEIRMRQTGVTIGNITSRPMIMLKKRAGEDKVIEDYKAEKGGLPSHDDSFVVKIGDVTERFSREDKDEMGKFTLPTLVKYVDAEHQFGTYAIWKGVVIYSKMSQNTMEHHKFIDPEVMDVRADEAGGLITDVAANVGKRNVIPAMTGETNLGKEYNLDRNTLTDIADVINKNNASGKTSVDMSNPKFGGLDDKTLAEFELLTALSNYDGLVDSYMKGGANEENTAYKQAFGTVLGDPDIIFSGLTKEEIMDKVKKVAIDYMAAEKNNPEGIANGDYRAAADVFMNGLFDFVSNKNVPEMIASGAENEEDAIRSYRLYVNDLYKAVSTLISDYGYNGLKLINTYSGGKYSTGNSLAVSPADASRTPIGTYNADKTVEAKRNEIITKVLKPVEHAIRFILPNPVKAMNLLENIHETASDLIDETIYEKLVDEGNAAFGETEPHAVACTLANAILGGAILGNSGGAGLVNDINIDIHRVKRNDVAHVVDAAIERAMKSEETGSFNKMMNLIQVIHQLTDNGKVLNPVRELMGGKTTLNKFDKLVYGEMLKAINKSRENINKLTGMAADKVGDAKIDFGIRQNTGVETKMGTEDDMKDIAVPENNILLSEVVETNLKNWKPIQGVNTYYGLTGNMGIDTIRVGKAETVGMADNLSNSESVSKGLNPAALIRCCKYIDEAKKYNAERIESGEKGAWATRNVKPEHWSDHVIDIIAKYMENPMTAKLNDDVDETDTRGNHELNGGFAGDWLEFTQQIVGELETACTNTTVPIVQLRDDLLKMLNNLVLNNETLEDISVVSTALAHAVLKVGEVSDSTSMPDPMGGTLNVPGSADKLSELATQRSMTDTTNRTEIGKKGLKANTSFLTSVGNSIKGDKGLIDALSNTYNLLGRSETEGSDSALDTLGAMVHAAEEKTHRAKTDVNVGKASTSFAAELYRKVFESESAHDDTYSAVTDTIRTVMEGNPVNVPTLVREGKKDTTNSVQFDADGNIVKAENAAKPETLDEVIRMAGLNGRIENGPLAGHQYAEVAFGDWLDIAGEMEPAEQLDAVSSIGPKIALAIRLQMTDNLLSDRTFIPIKESSSLWERLVDIYFGAATKIEGTDGSVPAISIFSSLDSATLNVAHEQKVKNIEKAMKSDVRLGAKADKEKWVEGITGVKTTNNIDASALKQALNLFIFGINDKERANGVTALKEILGKSEAEEAMHAINVNDLRENSSGIKEKPAVLTALTQEIIKDFGQSSSEKLHQNREMDENIIKTVNYLKAQLHNIFTGKGDASVIHSILGKEVGDRFIEAFGERVKKAGKDLTDTELDIMISDYINEHLHSAKSNARSRIVDYSAKDLKQGSSGSDTERTMNATELGGYHARPTNLSENETMKEKAIESVFDRLNKFNVKSSNLDKGNLFRDLKSFGFKGSVDKFCEDVLSAAENSNKSFAEVQEEIADRYANDMDNYQDDFDWAMHGPLGSLTYTKSLTNADTVERIAREMENAGLSSINLSRSEHGRYMPFVKFANQDKPIPLSSGDANRQMEILFDKYEDTYGKPFNQKDFTKEDLINLDKIARGSDIRTPIDPVPTTRELTPIVVAVMTKSVSGLNDGKPWMTAVGGVAGDRVFERTFTKNNNQFVFRIDENAIAKRISSLVNTTKFTTSELKKTIADYKSLKKDSVEGKLKELVDTVEQDIERQYTRMANAMVKSGSTQMEQGGISGKWLNPTAPKAPKPKAPKKAKPAPVTPPAPNPPQPSTGNTP